MQAVAKPKIARDEASKDKRIQELTEENRKLRAELLALQSKTDADKQDHASDPVYERIERQILAQKHFSHNHYTTYLLSRVMNTKFFKIFRNVINVVRKVSFIRTAINVIMFILLFIASGVSIVLTASTLLIYGLVTFTASYAISMLTLLSHHRTTRRIRKLTKGKKVYVFFPCKHDRHADGSFGKRWADSVAKDAGSVALVVSPFRFRSPVDNSRRLVITCYQNESGVIILRKHYYFLLKRKIFRHSHDSIIEIY